MPATQHDAVLWLSGSAPAVAVVAEAHGTVTDRGAYYFVPSIESIRRFGT